MDVLRVNKDPIDLFTAFHFAAGVGGYAAGLNVWTVAAIAVAWEFVEPSLKKSAPGVFPDPSGDSVPNATMDILAAVGGFYSAQIVSGSS